MYHVAVDVVIRQLHWLFWIRPLHKVLCLLQIYDWPDLKYRAFLVDSGHGRTLNSVCYLILSVPCPESFFFCREV